MKAFKLITTEDKKSAFQEGSIPDMERLPAEYFFIQTHVSDYEHQSHTDPRYQFVLTLKGKIKFTVSNSTCFILEPGIVLVAKDLTSEGHSWELLEGETWERIYIVPKKNAEDHFRISGEIMTIE